MIGPALLSLLAASPVPPAASALPAADSDRPVETRELPPDCRGYRLVFEDRFHPLDLSPDGRGDHAWYNGVWFRRRRPPNSAIETSLGFLSLHWNAGWGVPETSIVSYSRESRRANAWRYGYFEARMKWKPVTGSWPAFWLIPVEDAKGAPAGRRESGEIDVFEGEGSDPRAYYGTIHDWVDGKDVRSTQADNRIALAPATDLSRWHTYGLLWTPGRVAWFLDGRAVHGEHAYPVFDRQTYYLVLTEQVGDDWTYGSLRNVAERDLRLDVKWVRVWQARPGGGLEPDGARPAG